MKAIATIDRKPDPASEQSQIEQAKRQQLYNAHPDEISVELLPAARGLKLTMAFDAVYIALVAQMITNCCQVPRKALSFIGIKHIHHHQRPLSKRTLECGGSTRLDRSRDTCMLDRTHREISGQC